MLLSDFNFTPVLANQAVSDILTQLLTAVDINSNPLLMSAEQMNTLSIDNVRDALQPPPEMTPCVRATVSKIEAPQEGVSFVKTDLYYRLCLYFVYYGGCANFEDLRRAHIDGCIRVLEQPNQGSTLGLDQIGNPKWFFQISPWTYEEDYDTPLKYWGGSVSLTADYYVARVDLMVQINEAYNRA